MCGRIIVAKSYEEIKTFIYENYAKASFTQNTILPNYNLAPGSDVISIIYSNGVYRSGLINWGLRFDNINNAVINIREESIRTKNHFSKLYEKNRCLVLVDGFYEWDALYKTKQVYRFHLQDNNIFALAALWHKDRQNNFHCGIITTEANDLISSIHKRMPIILNPEESKEYLIQNDLSKASFLSTRKIANLQKHLVTPLVNKPSFNNEECIKILYS